MMQNQQKFFLDDCAPDNGSLSDTGKWSFIKFLKKRIYFDIITLNG